MLSEKTLDRIKKITGSGRERGRRGKGNSPEKASENVRG